MLNRTYYQVQIKKFREIHVHYIQLIICQISFLRKGHIREVRNDIFVTDPYHDEYNESLTNYLSD